MTSPVTFSVDFLSFSTVTPPVTLSVVPLVEVFVLSEFVVVLLCESEAALLVVLLCESEPVLFCVSELVLLFESEAVLFCVSDPVFPVEPALVSAPVALLSFCVAALFSDCVVWESPDVALLSSCPVEFCAEASAANDVTCVGIIITAAKIIAAILFVILFLFTFSSLSFYCGSQYLLI